MSRLLDLETELQQALAAGDLAAAELAARAIDAEPPKPAPSIIGAALWYASHGLPVFPLQAGSKVPLAGSRGVKDASTDPEVIRGMFNRPGLNLGLATGHRVDVIDFDGAKAHAAWGRAFGSWEEEGIQVLATVSTPRAGGLHVYMPTTGGGNRARLCPGVDFRGLGGYVVAPPSTTPLGSYRFLRALDPEELP
jgi:hypothetical protein